MCPCRDAFPRCSPEELYQALYEIEDDLKVANFFPYPGLPEAPEHPSTLSAEERAETYTGSAAADLAVRFRANVQLLSASQRHMWETLRSEIDEVVASLAGDGAAPVVAKARFFFLYARAGTGKTFVDQLALDYIRANGGVALAMCSSGIGALLLEGGTTVHSRLKVPLNAEKGDELQFGENTALADLL